MSKAEEFLKNERGWSKISRGLFDFNGLAEILEQFAEHRIKQEREKWEKELEEKQREVLRCAVNPIYFSDGHDYLSGLFGVVSSITGDSDLSEDKITNLFKELNPETTK